MLGKALDLKKADRPMKVRLARKDLQDALQLLEPVLLHMQDAVPMIKDARAVLEVSGGVTDETKDIEDAIVILQDAQAEMIIR